MERRKLKSDSTSPERLKSVSTKTNVPFMFSSFILSLTQIEICCNSEIALQISYLYTVVVTAQGFFFTFVTL